MKNWQELTQCRNSIIYFHCFFGVFFLWLIFSFFHHLSSSLFQRAAPLPFRKLVWRATRVTFHLSFELLSNQYFFSDVCLPFPFQKKLRLLHCWNVSQAIKINEWLICSLNQICLFQRKQVSLALWWLLMAFLMKTRMKEVKPLQALQDLDIFF